MITVKSAPGSVAPTACTAIVTRDPANSGASTLPSTPFVTIAPAGARSVQYADPSTLTSTFTSASAAVPSTAYTSFTACDASTITGGAAASSIARYPDT